MQQLSVKPAGQVAAALRAAIIDRVKHVLRFMLMIGLYYQLGYRPGSAEIAERKTGEGVFNNVMGVGSLLLICAGTLVTYRAPTLQQAMPPRRSGFPISLRAVI